VDEIMKKLIILILAIIISYAIPYGFAKVFSNILIESFSGGGAARFMIGVLSHRFAQLIVTILLFFLLFSRLNFKMGFNFDDIADKLNHFRSVFVIWPVLTAAFFLIATIFIDGFTDYLSNLYPLHSDWFWSKVVCDVLLLDALAEEVLYRAFIIHLIALYWKGSILLGSRSISHAALLSVPLFALSHVQVELFPFSIIGFDPIQLCLTMFTGLLFAYAYERTKNLVVPILLHGYTNLTITLVAYLTLVIG
jgi:hypothetical protein